MCRKMWWSLCLSIGLFSGAYGQTKPVEKQQKVVTQSQPTRPATAPKVSAKTKPAIKPKTKPIVGSTTTSEHKSVTTHSADGILSISSKVGDVGRLPNGLIIVNVSSLMIQAASPHPHPTDATYVIMGANHSGFVKSAMLSTMVPAPADFRLISKAGNSLTVTEIK